MLPTADRCSEFRNADETTSERQSATRIITEDEFFYVVQDNYDEHIELAIPFYRLMHDELIRLVPSVPNRPLRILDLGTGTGRTAKLLLDRFSVASLRAVDLFEQMLSHARVRLAPHKEIVEFILGDFRTTPLGNHYDLCVSALAIHHSTADEKKDLFARIFDALNPQGRFIMIDWTKFRSPGIQDTASHLAERNVAKSGVPEEIVEEWKHHWREENIPDTVEDMQQWLLNAGFRYAECVIRCYGIAMLCCEK